MSGHDANAHGADVIALGIGPGGEDVAGLLAEAGLDVVELRSMIYAYPTFHREVEDALRDRS